MKLLKDYVLGDTIARYMQPGPGGPVGMMLFPAAMAGQIAEKSSAIDSLVQIKTVGDTYPGGSAGRSLRNGGTVATLTVESQREETTDAGVTVVTLLRTHQGASSNTICGGNRARPRWTHLLSFATRDRTR